MYCIIYISKLLRKKQVEFLKSNKGGLACLFISWLKGLGDRMNQRNFLEKDGSLSEDSLRVYSRVYSCVARVYNRATPCLLADCRADWLAGWNGGIEEGRTRRPAGWDAE